MKKILLTLAIALTATLTYGQRDIDWSVEQIISPSIVNTGQITRIHIVCKNNGPNQGLVGDTLYTRVIYLGNTGTPVIYNWVYKVLTADLNAGDTIHHVFNVAAVTNTGNTFHGQLDIISRLQNQPDMNLEFTTNNVITTQTTYTGTLGWSAGVHDMSTNGSINVYPNPATDFINVNFNVLSKTSDFSLTMLDMTGKVVSTSNNTTGEFQINTSEFNKGLYIIKVQNGDQVTTTKVIIQ